MSTLRTVKPHRFIQHRQQTGVIMTVFGFGARLLQIRFSLFRSLMRIENRIKTT